MTNASLREMVSSSGLSDEQTGQVLHILEEYLAELERGGRPQPEELLARHPDLADLLKEYLDRLDLLHEAAVRFRVAEPPTDAAAPAATDLGRLGDFQLLREIGRGGMGIVYEAEQISLNRRVALKVLPFAATMDSRQLQRFQNEARAAAGLHHTNIVPVYYVGNERGVHYYAMQFIEGRDLASLVAQLQEQVGRKGAEPQPAKTVDVAEGQVVPQPASPGLDTRPIAGLSTEQPIRSLGYFRSVARLGIQAAEALDHAHQMGIVHRDVKPANLLLDATGRLWVTDFGLAQIQSDTRLTMTGDLVGTLRYMSPEQALAQRAVVDHRTDIYALGATLYELLTLEPVFSGRDRQDLLRQIAFEEPRRPRQVNRAIPRELETIVLKAMEKNATGRYATAQDLAEDLDRFVEDRPIQARRPTLPQRLARWGRRHPGLTAALGLATGLLLAGTWAWDRQTTQAETAAREVVKEAQQLQKEDHLAEALQAARRAGDLLPWLGGNAQLRQTIAELVADLQLLNSLEDAQMESASERTDGNGFDRKREALLYRQAFLDSGIDVLAGDEAAVAQALRHRAVVADIVVAIDEWARIAPDPVDRERLGRLAELLDPDPDQLASHVRRAAQARDRKTLEQLAEKAQASLPAPTVLIRLGNALVDVSATTEAVRLWRAGQQRYPADFRLNTNLGTTLREMGPRHVAEAVRFSSAAVALRPLSPSAWLNLGAALGSAERHVESEAAYRRALALKDFATAHSNLGNALSGQGRQAEAEAAFRLAIERDPSDAPAHSNLGALLWKQGKLLEAEKEFRQAIKLWPEFHMAHFNLGNALADLGRLPDAEKAYQRAIELRPDFADLYNNLGTTLGMQGRLAEAEETFRRAIKQNPENASAHHNLGFALVLQKRYPEAVSIYQRAIELKPEDATSYLDLANALGKQGRLAEAEKAIRRAIELNPDNVQAHEKLGHALFGQKRYEEAEKAFRRATELRSDLVTAHENLGYMYSRQNRHLEAVAAHRRTIELSPDDPRFHGNLGGALRSLGRYEEALTAYRRCHELGSKQPGWLFPSAQWVRDTERLIALAPRLPALLAGEVQPADAAESLLLARECHRSLKRYVAAARLFTATFAAEPSLARDHRASHRYDAACVAALAAAGQGVDAVTLDAAERIRLQRQALDWLNAELAALTELAADPGSRPLVRQKLERWQKDTDFAAVRDAAALAQLPEAERTQRLVAWPQFVLAAALAQLPEAEQAAWQKLWADVDDLLKRNNAQQGTEKAIPKP